jgi:hypothetical protein
VAQLKEQRKMFCNRQVLLYVATLSLLLAPSCSKQSEGDDTGTGTKSNVPPNALAAGTGSILTGTGNTTSTTDPNAVGTAVPLTSAEVNQLTASPNTCNAVVTEPETGPGRLLLLVDISSSMNETASGTNNRSKWDVTKEAIVQAICGVDGDASNPGLASATSVSLMFYPNQLNDSNGWSPAKGWTACFNANGITPMAQLGGFEAGSQRSLLRQTLLAVQLGRGTPTAGAYDYAVNDVLMKDKNSGTPYIVLITDGIPTLYHECYNPSGSLSDLADGGNEVIEEVKLAASTYGVKTFMIGSPGSEGNRAWMSQGAYYGGTAKSGCNYASSSGPYCHMDLTTSTNFGADLRAGLNEIAAQVVSCEFDILPQSADGSQKTDLSKISPIVTYSDGTAELLTEDVKNGAACTEGFYLESSTKGKFCSSTCTRVMSDANARTRILFGCTADTITNTILQ